MGRMQLIQTRKPVFTNAEQNVESLECVLLWERPLIGTECLKKKRTAF